MLMPFLRSKSTTSCENFGVFRPAGFFFVGYHEGMSFFNVSEGTNLDVGGQSPPVKGGRP